MTIPLNTPLVRQIIQRQYGSVIQLVAEWETRHEAGETNLAEPRDRTRISNWLADGLPRKEDVIFTFCSLLDVDPIGIIESSETYFKKQFWKERLNIFSKEKQTTLAALRDLYVPHQQWPKQDIPNRYFGKYWSTQDYLYDTTMTEKCYAACYIEPQDDLPVEHPRVFSFAYQVDGAIDKLWRPYGAIISYHDRIRLFHERGEWQEINKSEMSKNAVAETEFGQLSCWFRITSLHPFSLKVKAPSPETNAVRFR